MKTQKQADIALLLITMFWGLANVISEIAIHEMTSFQLNAIRFTIAFTLSWAFFRKKMKHISKATLKASLVIGLLLTGVYVLAIESLYHTDVTNMGFMLSLHVILVPVINFIFRKIIPEKKLIFCICIATVGLGLLTLGGSAMKIRLGDVMAFLSTTLYAVDMICTDVFVAKEDVDPLQLGILQLGVCAVLFMAYVAITGQTLLVTGVESWACILYLAIFATAAAFIVQPVAQSLTSVSRVGIIFACEPAFTSLSAFFIIRERLPLPAYLGAAMMFVSLIVMNIELPSKRKTV